MQVVRGKVARLPFTWHSSLILEYTAYFTDMHKYTDKKVFRQASSLSLYVSLQNAKMQNGRL